MARIAPVNAKGTRDFLPRDLVRRNRVFTLLRETFERHGYEPLETPAVENTHVLEGKYGEEGDRLLFRILKRGRELESSFGRAAALPEDGRGAAALARELSDEALRYDLTVPLARVIAARQNDIVFPFRRYQMQPVWRADRPQRGRYREFYQCDVDCVGSHSMTVDAEMAAIYCEVFTRLGFTSFVTRINHRGLLAALMESCGVAEELRGVALVMIDKLDKIGAEGVRGELVKAGLSNASTDKLMAILEVSGAPRDVIAAVRPVLGESAQGETALRELDEVFAALAMMGVPAERYRFDLSLVRGLSYYTGTIYETVLTDSTLGSLGGGGRYDRLIGMFTGQNRPCVGISFGLDRIFDALDEKKLLTDKTSTTTQALVTLLGPQNASASFTVARTLRQAGIRTEVYADFKDLKTQLTFANRKGIPLVCIIGDEERQQNVVTLRDMRTSTQEAVTQESAAARVRALLGMGTAIAGEGGEGGHG